MLRQYAATAGGRLTRARLTVGSLAGIPLSLHWSWLPCIVLVAVLDRDRYSSSWWRVAELLSLFVVVLLHELGHALAARYRRTPVREIVLWPLGGLAIGAAPRRWKDEFVIVGAGPLVNVVLGPVLFGLWYEFGYFRGGDISQLLWSLAWANVAMLIFNLLPIWPLDGGRLVQSALCGCIGVVRSRLLSGVLGVTCAVAGLLLFTQLRDPLTVALLSALTFTCVSSVQWAASMLRAERHWGLDQSAICPECGSHPLDAPTGSCERCGERCNLFRHDGRCWNCGSDGDEVACRCCGARSRVEAWRVGTAAMRPAT